MSQPFARLRPLPSFVGCEGFYPQGVALFGCGIRERDAKHIGQCRVPVALRFEDLLCALRLDTTEVEPDQ